MWTCPKCGEKIEDQFDSCWRCAPQQQPAAQTVSPGRLKPLDYFTALLVAYAIPFASLFVSGNPVDTGAFRKWGAWAVMGIPGAVSFLVLWPFLRRPAMRRIALVGLCLVWAYLFILATPHTK